MEVLLAENVLARRYFYPGCHRMEPYHSNFPHSGLSLPETEKVSARVISLPTGTSIEPKDIEIICRVIKLSVEEGSELKSMMNARTVS